MANDQKLENIENLLALNLIDGKNTKEAINLLHKADYTSKEIGEFIGLSASRVRDKISELKQEGKINA